MAENCEMSFEATTKNAANAQNNSNQKSNIDWENYYW